MLQLISIFLLIQLFQGNDASNKTINGVSGPCIGNRNNMKCTKNGFYEKIQCNKNSCYCVAAHNGIPAYNTRTSSPQTKPTCGKCLNHLENMFKNGKTGGDKFIPQCDVISGNYEIYQCNAEKQFCYCSDENGAEIKGSRIKLNPNSETNTISCGNKKYKIDYHAFVQLDEDYKKSFINHYPNFINNRPECTDDRVPGDSCGRNKPSIRYWFDVETLSCLPFEYKGCKGNTNNYLGSCMNCLPMGYMACGFGSERARNSDGSTFRCSNPDKKANSSAVKLNDSGCPSGYSCLSGRRGNGICCDKIIQETSNNRYSYTCSNGNEAEPIDQFGYRTTLYGKSCSDNFCPSGTKCEQGEVFAYCCK